MEKDLPTILQMAEDFYLIDQYSFDKKIYQECFLRFINNKDLGRFYMIKKDEASIGYIVISFGFSFEYGGRDAFLDEFFIENNHRNSGLGTKVLDFILEEIKNLHVRALHLEVEDTNSVGIGLYKKFGFGFNNRKLLTKSL